jgi:predicted AlkP superfamily phosphohydrolase/phosphomutase
VSARVVVIGLDAANGGLLRRWASEGALPNLGALVQRGRVTTLCGIEGFFTGATWPSLLTAANPARHGIHYLAQLVPGTYQFSRPHEAEYIRSPLFWEDLKRAGRRLAILDVPLTKPDPTMPGIQTIEWAGHDRIFGFQTTPPELARDILRCHGPHPAPSDCDTTGRSPEGFTHFVETLTRGVEAKARLTVDLLSRESWDLFMQVFTESHCIGHQCWHLHDPEHPAHDPALVDKLGDPVRLVYQAIDTAVGDILSAAGDAAVYLLVPHGMCHSIGVNQLLPTILERLGLSVPLPPKPQRLGPLEIAQAIGRRLPGPVTSALRAAFARVERPGSFGLPTLDVDTSASRCFPVPNGLLVSGIRLNLAGREPRGNVQPGTEAAALIDQLRDDLLAIRDERTQRPLVRRVLTTAAIYSGPHLDLLPDVLVEWHDEAPVGTTLLADGRASVIRATSPKIGTVEAVNGYGRTGEHRSDGLLIAAGPGIVPGERDHPLSLLDVAPTIVASLGAEMTVGEGRAAPQFVVEAREAATDG